MDEKREKTLLLNSYMTMFMCGIIVTIVSIILVNKPK